MIRKLKKRLLHLNRTVLGINARNLDYIYPLNPRHNFPNADDKLRCKLLLDKHGLPHPKTLAVYREYGDLLRLESDVKSLDSFVLKPAQGYGGRGIKILQRAANGSWVTSENEHVDIESIYAHIHSILAGYFSLEKLSDAAFIEQRVVPDETLGAISYKGLPDIRILLCKDKPVMAMVRVPTKQSAGLANLHQGAIGLGVDMQTGVTTRAILKTRSITAAPGIDQPLVGLHVPHWKTILDMSVRASRIFGLGYLGVDIVIDKTEGPLVIEVNARPGLNIQLANAQGLAGKILRGNLL